MQGLYWVNSSHNSARSCMTNEKTSPPISGGKSLRTVLLLALLVCIALPALASGSFLIWKNYHRTIEKETMAAAEGYADILEGGLAVALWNVSPDLGQSLIDSVKIDRSVVSISVYSEDGKKFLSMDRTDETSVSDSETAELTRQVTYQGTPVGEVSLVYSLDSARARAMNESKLLITTIVIQLAFSLMAILFLLHHRVIAPLSKLTRAASGIASGDLKTTIPVLRDDEFGALSLRLEVMRGALERNINELESRVDARTEELMKVNVELRNTLEQLEKTQDDLIQSEKLAALGSLVAGVAHELNTPIGNGLTVATSMNEACKEISKQIQAGLTRSALARYVEDMTEGSQLVHRNLDRASELVTSFKQVAIDRTSVARRQFSLHNLVSETCLTLSPMLKRTPYVVDVQINDDVKLDSYPGPLGQVVTNLLNNSVIHGFDKRDHGCITIASKAADGFVVLVIEDDGKGISKEHQDKIFNPFFTTKLGAGGNGLGMHIVHNIVTSMLGGQITFDSEPGKGTRFFLKLPLRAPHIQAQEDDFEMAGRHASSF